MKLVFLPYMDYCISDVASIEKVGPGPVSVVRNEHAACLVHTQFHLAKDSFESSLEPVSGKRTASVKSQTAYYPQQAILT
jgi:hypothetical protein